MKKFKAKVKFTFIGEVELNAKDDIDAYHQLHNNFGMTIGNIRGLGDIINWEFPVHPEKKVTRIKMIKDET